MEPKIIIKGDSLEAFCPNCYYKVRSYDLNPCFPDIEDLKSKIVESPKDLYPNYCENCGEKLK